MQNSLKSLLLLLNLLWFTVPGYAASALADNSAVILMYHNIAEDTPASTSVTPEIFNKHMLYLENNNFIVWPLFKTLLHLASGKPIPEKIVVLTFDDAYKSVYNEAFPILKAKRWPFTVFVTTKYIGEGYTHYMSWAQLREIQQFGGEIGNHSLSHPHMIRQRSTETKEQWRTRIIGEIHQAQYILHQQLRTPIWVLAYPYGEYDLSIKQLLREMGYFGLGQHSGAVSYTSDMQALSRYPMATGFDGLDDFAIKVSTKKLPVTVLSPVDGVVLKDTDIPKLTLRLEAGNYKKESLVCYASGQGRIQLEWIDRVTYVVRVTANKTMKPGRMKYNCTAPSKTEAGVFYWFSFLWMKPEADGSWYNE